MRDYCNADAEHEWLRVEHRRDRIEFASALRLIRTYLPVSGCVADIGCGAGRCFIELLRRGHDVTLLVVPHDRSHPSGRERATSRRGPRYTSAEQRVNGGTQTPRILSLLPFMSCRIPD